jgi:hypothetical protein
MAPFNTVHDKRRGGDRMRHNRWHWNNKLASDCCCIHPRHFMTSAEKQKMLEQYRDELEKELAGVKERIDELSGD